MLKVGLTGNIASGKSAVAEVWRSLGANVVDADELARRAVEPGSEGLRRIVERWGERVLDPSGALDRAALRDIVFRDPEARAELEAIIHPRVAALRDEEVAAVERAGERIVVADIPLLFEVGLDDEFDLVVLVDASPSLRRERIVRQRGLSPAEAERMIAAQMPSHDKRPRADIIIDNDASLDELRSRAREVWERIRTRADVRS